MNQQERDEYRALMQKCKGMTIKFAVKEDDNGMMYTSMTFFKPSHLEAEIDDMQELIKKHLEP